MAEAMRLDWIKEKACKGLGVSEELFNEMLEEGAQPITDFLDGGEASALMLTLEKTTIQVEELHEAPRTEEEHQEDPAQGEAAEGGEGADGAPEGEEGEKPAEGEAPPEREEAAAGEAPPAEGEAPPAEAAAPGESEAPPAEGEVPPAEGAAEGEKAECEEGAPAEGEEGEAKAPPPPPEPAAPKMISVMVPKEINKLHISVGSLPEALSACRSFYFLKSKPGRVVIEEIDSMLEHGLLCEGPSLRLLESTISNVYLPVLLQMAGVDNANPGMLIGNTANSSYRDLLGNMQKFLSQVSHALQQLNGDVTLLVPDVIVESVEKAVLDSEIVLQLETAMSEWSTVLATVMQRESEKTPSGKGPLAEIEFWRERNAVLSSIYEQLNLPQVRKMMNVVETGSDDRNLLTGFKSQMAELTKLAAEARDNVKFLTTLERHFKNISSGPLHGILDTLPPMMNALRMVWIISRHYSDDQRMGSLFQRIAREIGDRVEVAIDMRNIFRNSPQEAVDLVREKIEMSGRDARWEFPKQLLFARTNYMADICNDIIEMVEIVDDFFKFLGPELKAVTGDTQGIDRVVQRVKAMYEPVEAVMFNIFDYGNNAEWKAIKATFYADNEDIKSATRELIDTSFRKLRSAEGACDLLQSFKSIKSKGAIQKQVINKFNDIVEQFTREIDATMEIFETNKEDPPVTKNQPPIAGAIKWSRSLLARVKQTMAKLQSTEEEIIRTTEIGQNMEAKFKALARSIMYFEKKSFSTWSESINSVATVHLKRNVFRKNPETGIVERNVFRKNPETGIVEVKFHADLIKLIRETRYLDRMGFPIPELALNVALQEDKYHAWLEGLEVMLSHYYEVINQLSPIEKELMAKKLTDLEGSLHAGFHILNWNSLGIPEFIQAASKSINAFQQIVKQNVVYSIAGANIITEPDESAEVMDLTEFYDLVEKERLESVDKLVKKYRTISPILGKIEEVVAGTNTGKSPQLHTYYGYWERAIFNALNKMVLNAMDTLQQMIDSRRKRRKVEVLPDGSRPPAPKVPLFKITFSLQNVDIVIQPPVNEVSKALGKLVRALVESSKPFVRWMDGTSIETPEQRGTSEDDEPVVFNFYWDVAANPQVIKAMLQLNQSIQKAISGVNRYLESWRRHQSLWKTDKSSVLDKFKAREPTCSSFEEKLAKYTKPMEYDQDFIQVSCHTLAISVREEALGWVRSIGQSMRELDIASLAALRDRIAAHQTEIRKTPETLEELKLVLNTVHTIHSESMLMELKYSDLEERYRTRILYAQAEEMDQCSAELADASLIRDQWVELADEADLVDYSLEETKKKFTETTRTQVTDFLEYKSGGPGLLTIELAAGLDLLHVYQTELDTATKCKSGGPGLPTIELAAGLDLLHVYQTELDTATKYKSGGPGLPTIELAAGLDLLHVYQTELGTATKYKSGGPGLPTIELAAGLDLLHVYQTELDTATKQREQLVLAQKLFNMEITSYPLLSAVEQDMKKLSAVYAVYAEQAEAVRSYGNLLWSELDVGKMMTGTEEILAKLYKLKHLKLLPVYENCDREIQGFFNSLPLMKELKSEALRKRHWTQLMEVTSQDFDMDPKTFTLGNMFSMQLHKYADEIGRITNAAVKELTIESEIKKLSEVWREQKFDLGKYMKGSDDRGWVLKATDDITVLLEDMGLNLQSMMASPFVKPFQTDVRAWEQKLSLIGECIEVWMFVQRKWMYLESIFIGSDDIRLQLPQEAKRFDTIDKAWQKIMNDTAKNTNSLADQLEVCQKSLSEYLDTKRCAFPRFFFISDDELLSILGTSDPTSVQEHMLKLFDNCALLKFGRGNKTVIGMVSSEKEAFDFRQPVPIEGAVEIWMTNVQAEMRRTLFAITKEGVFYYAKSPRTKWIGDNLGMVTLVGSQIWWTWETEDVFRRVREGNKHGMKDFAAKLTGQLAELTTMVRSDLSGEVRKKVNTLIIIDVHARDIVDNFDDIIIKQCTGTFKYGYEFMGLNGRLVITGLTDRCYMTLTTGRGAGLCCPGLDLYETMMTRHTTMVVGQTGGGKTVILNTLARSQTKMGTKTTLYTLNPKAISVAELYGVLDPDTRDWTDGLLSNIFRETSKPLAPDKDEARFIVFDGDVDAVWVENMNSVMDDNKLLTLPNGERIRLQNHCKLLFEVFDLQFASPATISRCGMVYVDSRNLGYKPYVTTWLEGDLFDKDLFDKYAVPCVDWVIDGLDGDELVRRPKMSVPLTNLNVIMQLCHLLDTIIVDHPRMSDPQSPDRDRFDSFLKRQSGLSQVDGERTPATQLPSTSLYEYQFDTAEGCWRAWKTYVLEYEPPADGMFSKIVVPTVDVVRTTWILSTVVSAGRPCLLRAIEDSTEKRTKDTYGPPMGKRLLMFIDDLNMPRVDLYGTQQPIALLKLFTERKGLYDRGKPIALLKLFTERKGLYDRG
eukprot:gene31817-7021_t